MSQSIESYRRLPARRLLVVCTDQYSSYMSQLPMTSYSVEYDPVCGLNSRPLGHPTTAVHKLFSLRNPMVLLDKLQKQRVSDYHAQEGRNIGEAAHSGPAYHFL